ncbi:MAG: pyridoxamine 5'-phosphate oxidase family protein [Betaproteobacteria bacterium]
MPHAYANIAFTPAVRDVQSRMGSRESYARFSAAHDKNNRIGAREAEFIAARDSFYQATVSETGWPYVQFRGGPAGFLKVLDAQTLGYADFRGNMQYVSVGNLTKNNRVSIILMDYANRERLKILGRVRIVELDDDPAILTKLESPTYRARVQRGVVIDVEAFDWNCPQHITPRFTEAEISQVAAGLHVQIADLKAQLATYTNAASGLNAKTRGDGRLV